MSDSQRQVCGESLSSHLIDRDAGVIGKKISQNPYTSMKIGSVGKRLSNKMNQMIARREKRLPGAIQRLNSHSTIQNMFRFGNPNLTYLLWSPDIEEEIEESLPTESPWFESKRSYVGAKTFRMPSSLGRASKRTRRKNRPTRSIEQPSIETETALPPLRASKRQAYKGKKRSTPLSRAFQQLDRRNTEMLPSVQALESLPPFLAKSPSVQKRVLQSLLKEDRNDRRFAPKSLQEKFFAPKIQDEMQDGVSAADQARYRLASQRKPKGLRPVAASSPMMQALSSFQVSQEDPAPVQESTPSPWYRSTTSKNRTERSAFQAPTAKATSPQSSTKKAVLSSLRQSFQRRLNPLNAPSARIAQQINETPALQEAPPSVQALQRISLGSDENQSSLLPTTSLFSRHSKISKAIARHQSSAVPQREGKEFSADVASARSVRPDGARFKRQQSRKMYTLSDLLPLQHSAVQEREIEAKVEKPSVWMQSKARSADVQKPKSSVIARKAASAQSDTVVSDSSTRSIEDGVRRAATSNAANRFFEEGAFGFAEPKSSDVAPSKVSSASYAAERAAGLSSESVLPKVSPLSSASQYEPLDKRGEALQSKITPTDRGDILARTQGQQPVFRSTTDVATDFVGLNSNVAQPISEESAPAEKQSPWYKRSPILHAAQRQVAAKRQGLLPKVTPTDLRQARAGISQEKKAAVRPIERASSREPAPTTGNPSRPQVIRSQTGNQQLGRLAENVLERNLTKVDVPASQRSWWADVRYRRPSPISYAQPNQIVVSASEKAEESRKEQPSISSAKSPWLSHRGDNASMGADAAPSQEIAARGVRSQSADRSSAEGGSTSNLPSTRSSSRSALSHMIARMDEGSELPRWVEMGTVGRSYYSAARPARLSVSRNPYQAPESIYAQSASESAEKSFEAAPEKPNSPWLSYRDDTSKSEKRVEQALIKRVAKMGIRARTYNSANGTMIDAVAAQAMGMSPPKGRSRIPLAWVLEAVDLKSNSASLPNWAKRASQKPLIKGSSDFAEALNKTSSMDDVIRVIFERTSNKAVKEASLESLPSSAVQVIQQIRKEAHQLEQTRAESQREVALSRLDEKGSPRRRKRTTLPSFTGLKPIATAPVQPTVIQDDKLSKLTRRLEDLILVAEQQGKKEAQQGARLAEDSSQAIEEGRGDPKGADEGVNEQMNLDALYRDVLHNVENAMNLKRILRFDNDDQFDGGW
ncbi:MAG: hypothetical protein VX278_01450 [Myxococcota bacterium]|nr:hypothetical protein [Myxococcota bacterium]